jgi:hypothetical protein
VAQPRRSRYSHSERLFAAATRILPGGVNSPVRAFKSVGGTPLFIERARGAQIEDADGHTYIDYVMSWGPLIHGHAPKGLLKAGVLTTPTDGRKSRGHADIALACSDRRRCACESGWRPAHRAARRSPAVGPTWRSFSHGADHPIYWRDEYFVRP